MFLYFLALAYIPGVRYFFALERRGPWPRGLSRAMASPMSALIACAQACRERRQDTALSGVASVPGYGTCCGEMLMGACYFSCAQLVMAARSFACESRLRHQVV